MVLHFVVSQLSFCGRNLCPRTVHPLLPPPTCPHDFLAQNPFGVARSSWKKPVSPASFSSVCNNSYKRLKRNTSQMYTYSTYWLLSQHQDGQINTGRVIWSRTWVVLATMCFLLLPGLFCLGRWTICINRLAHGASEFSQPKSTLWSQFKMHLFNLLYM